MGVVDMLRFWAQWNSLIISILTITGFFIHFFNPTRQGIEPCLPGDAMSIPKQGSTTRNNLGGVSCIGTTLRWSTGLRVADGAAVNPVGDINQYWRETFSFRPRVFCDLWTPLFLGAFMFLNHLSGNHRFIKMVANSWMMSAIFAAIVALWAQFGYGGNFGVFVGFYSCCGYIPFCLILEWLDKEVGEDNPTVLDLSSVFSCIGGGDDKAGDAADAADAAEHGNEA
jgi:hypothetical protein